MKIGFYGGAFNPPTKAHINLASKALRLCKLDKLIFVPMGDFYEKKGLAKGEDRFNMLKIACETSCIENIEVSDLELKVKKKMHAIEAFRLIEKEYPNVDRYFIMGADNFINISNWKESEELINNYKYIVIQRGNIEINGYISNNKRLKKCNVIIIPNDEYKMNSSTEFRKLLNSDKKQEIVQSEVLEYILKNNIYREKQKDEKKKSE